MEYFRESPEKQLEIYRDIIECQKRELDFCRSYYERAKLAESLLTVDQKMEYYRLLNEREL